MADDPWTPNPDQMALWPHVSGNAINGLHETAPRRPRHVYWAPNPDDIPHGDAQRWFYTQNDHPDLHRQRDLRRAEETRPLAALAATALEPDPAALSAQIKAHARSLGAEVVGIARIDSAWVYEGHDMPWSWIIVMGMAMDYEPLSRAPAIEAGVEVVVQYNRGMRTAKALANWLRQQGIDAACEHGPFAGALTLIPAALAAGLGELGKHGSIINRELGAMFRLTAVLTNAPLQADTPDDFGADSFCQRCRICENACPPTAIAADKQTVRGQTKWYVDFDRCLPYFNESAGCAICLAACPFSRPDVGPNLMAKLARQREKR